MSRAARHGASCAPTGIDTIRHFCPNSGRVPLAPSAMLPASTPRRLLPCASTFAVLTVVLLWTFELPSGHAFDERHQAMVFGVGQKTCGQMKDDVKASDSGRQMYESYILGYLSAVNTSFRGPTNFFTGGDSAGWYKFVVLYCESHPPDPVLLAVEKLVKHYKNDFPPK